MILHGWHCGTSSLQSGPEYKIGEADPKWFSTIQKQIICTVKPWLWMESKQDRFSHTQPNIVVNAPEYKFGEADPKTVQHDPEANNLHCEALEMNG